MHGSTQCSLKNQQTEKDDRNQRWKDILDLFVIRKLHQCGEISAYVPKPPSKFQSGIVKNWVFCKTKL